MDPGEPLQQPLGMTAGGDVVKALERQHDARLWVLSVLHNHGHLGRYFLLM